MVGVGQDFAGLLQPGEQRGTPARPPLGREPLRRGQRLGPFGQMLSAEQLAADRAGEQILAGIGAEGRGENGERAAGVELDGRASL
jgi:hypothetical protein